LRPAVPYLIPAVFIVTPAVFVVIPTVFIIIPAVFIVIPAVFIVIPAKAGTDGPKSRNRGACRLGPRFRGDDEDAGMTKTRG
jgi:hypothetical protein